MAPSHPGRAKVDVTSEHPVFTSMESAPHRTSLLLTTDIRCLLQRRSDPSRAVVDPTHLLPSPPSPRFVKPRAQKPRMPRSACDRQSLLSTRIPGPGEASCHQKQSDVGFSGASSPSQFDRRRQTNRSWFESRVASGFHQFLSYMGDYGCVFDIQEIPTAMCFLLFSRISSEPSKGSNSLGRLSLSLSLITQISSVSQ